MTENNIFNKLLLLSALLLATCGAYYSIIGISTLFSGAAIAVGIMAGAIEFSKLCATTFLYRYWNTSKLFLKVYLSIAIIVLMCITSMGIFGYLSSAYQTSSSNFKNGKEKISIIETQRDYLTNKIYQSKLRISTLNDVRKIQENRLSTVLTNDFLTRNPIQLRLLQEQTTELIKSSDDNINIEQKNIQLTSQDIEKINDTILQLNSASNNKKDITTFQFVADQFGVSLDTVAKWFIFVIVIIFDPLAVAMLLAYNSTKSMKLSIQSISNQVVDVLPPTPVIPPTANITDVVPIISQVTSSMDASTIETTLDTVIKNKVDTINPPPAPYSDFVRQMFKL